MRPFVILCALIATPALAMEKEALCENTRLVINAVVEERMAGAPQAKAEGHVKKSLEGDLAVFKDAVPTLADWIYELPEDQLSEEEVGAAYKATCLEN